MAHFEQDGTRTARGRPRGFDVESALEAAMLTFWEKGYHETSLDDLVERTGASRSSLYKTFGDKRALFLRAVDLYGSRFEQRAEAAMAEEPDAPAVLRRLLTASAERLTGSAAPAGCLRCNSTLELMGSQEALDDALRQANDRYLNVMRRIIARGVEEGSIAPASAPGLPLFLTGAVNGMVTLSLAGAGRADLLGYADRVLAAAAGPAASGASGPAKASP